MRQTRMTRDHGISMTTASMPANSPAKPTTALSSNSTRVAASISSKRIALPVIRIRVTKFGCSAPHSGKRTAHPPESFARSSAARPGRRTRSLCADVTHIRRYVGHMAAKWAAVSGLGHRLDADKLPLGHLGPAPGWRKPRLLQMPGVGLKATQYQLRDPWERKDLGPAESIDVKLSSHACVLYRPAD